jgi:hypothetical protein
VPVATRPTHPSPHRGRAPVPALVFGLVGGPAAWFIQLLVSSGLGQEACYPKAVPLSAPAFAGLATVLPVMEVAAILVALAAALTAYVCWRRSRGERAGDGHSLVDIGEGRSRFMAMAGILTSLGFAGAILFTLPAILAVRGC